jgi:hypothetical protein
MKTPLLLVLVLVLGLVLWPAGSDTEVASPTVRNEVDQERGFVSLVAPQAQPGAAAPGQRASVAGASSPVALPAGPVLEQEAMLELFGRVRDDQDLPVQDATVWIAPRGAGFSRAARTDAAGSFQLRLAAFRTVLDVLVAVESRQGGVSGIQSVRLDARVPTELDLGLAAVANVGLMLEGAILSLEGMSIGGGDSGSFVITFVSNNVLGDPVLAAAPRMHSDDEGVKRFTEAFASTGCPQAQPLNAPQQTIGDQSLNSGVSRQVLQGHIVAGTNALEFGSFQVVSGEGVGQAEGGGTQSSISGHVLGVDGESVADASIALLTAEGAVRARTRSDGEGRYAFAGLEPGPVTLVAGGGGHGVARLETELAAGEELGFDPVLDRGRELVGALRAEDGTPLAGWIVELVSRAPGSLWTKRVHTDQEGRFSFANAPNASVELVAFGKDEEARLPRLTRDALVTGGAIEPIVVAASDLLEHTLTVDLRDAFGAPLPDAWGRLESVTSGRALHLGRDTESGLLRSDGLPSGRYELLLGGSGGLQAEVIEIQLAGGTAQSLEALRLPASAGLVVSRAESPDAATPTLMLWRLRGTHRGLVCQFKVDGLGSIALAPGAYLAGGPGGARGFLLDEYGAVRLVARPAGANDISIEAFACVATVLKETLAEESEATAIVDYAPLSTSGGLCLACHHGAGRPAEASDAALEGR